MGIQKQASFAHAQTILLALTLGYLCLPSKMAYYVTENGPMDTAKPAAPVTVPFHSKDTGENEKKKKNSRNRKKRRKTRDKTESGQQQQKRKKKNQLY